MRILARTVAVPVRCPVASGCLRAAVPGGAIGDHYNDGRPDLLVVNKTGGWRLSRSLGGGEIADGTTETAEGQAGSGYHLQSSTRSFFFYPDANPPRRRAIRWPDSSTAFQALPPMVANRTVSQ